MRRATAAVIAVVALAAAGCGSSPEDKANDAGKNIGEELYDLRTASDSGDASEALQSIREEFQEARGELSGKAADQVQQIGQDLQSSLQSASDPAARVQAFATALAQLQTLRSNTDSVLNSFIDGIREGYTDAD